MSDCTGTLDLIPECGGVVGVRGGPLTERQPYPAGASYVDTRLCLQVVVLLGCPVVPLFPFWGVLGSLINALKQKGAPFLSLGYCAA